MNTALYETYVQILHEELVPAMGCTEPIAVAYAGALARQTLGALPERIELTVSGNIIKNVKSVIVPHTGGRKGLPVAVAAGVRVGDADAQLEVLANVTEDQLPLLDEYLSAAEITVSKSPLRCPFDIQVRVFAGGDTAFVQIVGSHTNVVRIEKNGEVLLNKPFSEEAAQPPESRRSLTVKDIIVFADEVDLNDVRAPIARQIEYNTAIAEAGLTGQYGAAIGKILLDSYGDSVQNRAKAWAAAGSDARMNGCEKPVVINSGSGNQGHDGFAARHCLRARAESERGAALPRARRVESCHHPSENGHRQPFRLLRCDQRGRRGRGGCVLPLRWALR